MDSKKFKIELFKEIAMFLELHHSQFYSGYLSGLFRAYDIYFCSDFDTMRMEYNQWARATDHIQL